jgi:hypothetical protein
MTFLPYWEEKRTKVPNSEQKVPKKVPKSVPAMFWFVARVWPVADTRQRHARRPHPYRKRKVDEATHAANEASRKAALRIVERWNAERSVLW